MRHGLEGCQGLSSQGSRNELRAVQQPRVVGHDPLDAIRIDASSEEEEDGVHPRLPCTHDHVARGRGAEGVQGVGGYHGGSLVDRKSRRTDRWHLHLHVGGVHELSADFHFVFALAIRERAERSLAVPGAEGKELQAAARLQLLHYPLVVGEHLGSRDQRGPARPQAFRVDTVEGCGLVERHVGVGVVPVATRPRVLVDHDDSCRTIPGEELVREGHPHRACADDQVIGLESLGGHLHLSGFVGNGRAGSVTRSRASRGLLQRYGYGVRLPTPFRRAPHGASLSGLRSVPRCRVVPARG